MKRLGVNIDHVATLRNARGELHPDPLFAAKYVKKKGADSITIHLREDRRHIKDLDAKKICSIKGLLVNLEIWGKDFFQALIPLNIVSGEIDCMFTLKN